MSSSLEKLPAELFASMVSHLSLGDCFSLLQVSKTCHALLEALLWSSVEMHSLNDHTGATHPELCNEEVATRKRPAYDFELPRLFSQWERTRRFLGTLAAHPRCDAGLSEARRSYLGGMVKTLCISIKIAFPWASSFGAMLNLEHLEISYSWRNPETEFAFEEPERGFPKLRTVKLNGYIPGKVVRWFLREGRLIEDLELAILDRPVSSGNLNPEDQNNPVPLENKLPADLDELSEEEMAKWEGVEDLSHCEWIAPRPLACLTEKIMKQLINLNRLYLCKPGNGEESMSDVLYFSVPAEERILEEWNALLRATRNTLQVLTLDQRAVAEENAPDGTVNSEYMLMCANGQSYRRFIKSILPTLLEKEEWPNLRAIRLFGFEAHEEGVDPDQRIRDHPDDSVDVPGQLRAVFPDANVTDHTGSRLRIYNDSGEVLSYESFVMETDRWEGEESDLE